jgi:hypothetical protein
MENQKSTATLSSDPLFVEIAAKLDRGARLGQRILAPFIYLACIAVGIAFTIDGGSWILGAFIGVVIRWVLARLSYYPIKWSLIALGVYAAGSA